MLIEALIAGLVLLPALYLALVRSPALLAYGFVVFAFNRGLRRLVDFYLHQEFNPFSLISLTPLVVACLMLGPALLYFRKLPRQSVPVFALLLVALLHGLAVGIMLNGIGALYSFGEWLAGFGAMAFAATLPASDKQANGWIRACIWTGIGVAIYGWWQYFTIPPWDAFWVRAVNLEGYLGNLKPTEMSLFSTMASRGPCASYLGWCLIPLIIDSRWRVPLRWLVAALLLATMSLTLARSMFIVVALVAVIHPLLTRGQSLVRILLFALVFVLGATLLLDFLPGADRIQSRVETFQNLSGDGSLQARLNLYSQGFSQLASMPLGFGLGSSGLADRVSRTSATAMDSGYIQIFYQFGWVGGLSFFASLTLLWKEATRRIGRGSRDPFVTATRSILLGCLIYLFVTDGFAGFAVFWAIFGRALNRKTLPSRPSSTAARHESSTEISVSAGKLSADS
jgi:putative inorganic carbon (hco3(-)) transporter